MGEVSLYSVTDGMGALFVTFRMMYNGIPVEVLYLESAAAHSYAFFDIDESIWKFAGYYRLRANLILFDDQIPGQKLGVPEHQHCLYRFKWVGNAWAYSIEALPFVSPLSCLYYFPAQGEHLVELGFIYSVCQVFDEYSGCNG